MIYCEPKSDTELQTELQDVRSVFLAGCSLCANISYCIHGKLNAPMYSLFSGAGNTKRELKRLRDLFEQAGVEPRTRLLFCLCFLTRWQQNALRRKAAQCEKVLTLSCEYGRANVQACVGVKEVISAMRNKGFMRSSGILKGLSVYINPHELYINNKKYVD
jgi:hypothetical protein